MVTHAFLPIGEILLVGAVTCYPSVDDFDWTRGRRQPLLEDLGHALLEGHAIGLGEGVPEGEHPKRRAFVAALAVMQPLGVRPQLYFVLAPVEEGPRVRLVPPAQDGVWNLVLRKPVLFLAPPAPAKRDPGNSFHHAQ